MTSQTGSRRRLAALLALGARCESVSVSAAAAVPEARAVAVVCVEEPHDCVVGALAQLLRHAAHLCKRCNK